jgi:hypothetical protein
MTRVDQQQAQRLETTLRQLRTDLDAIRTAQTFGSSSVQLYRVLNPTSNVDITLPSVSATSSSIIEITITPNTAASNPAITFDLAASIVGGVGTRFYRRWDYLPPVSGVQKVRFNVSSISGTVTNVAVGFCFWTISPATYSVVQIA